MKSLNYFLIVMMFCISQSSYSQTVARDILQTVFAGSTPCNLTVNKGLQIPPSDPCEFMRWELSISPHSNSFKLLISYGAYLPNTETFLNGGKSISFYGKLSTASVVRNATKYNTIHLVADDKATQLWFIRFDDNILHLADSNMKLVKGNAGHAFILNRIND